MKLTKYKSLLGGVFLISLSLSLSSCKWFDSQPDSPSYMEFKFVRAKDPGKSYFYYTDGNQVEKRVFIKDIPISPTKPSDVWVGLDLNSRNEIVRYETEMNEWVPKHCKD
jgi:hypothetical protein